MPHRGDESLFENPKDPTPRVSETAIAETGGNIRNYTLKDVELTLHTLAMMGGNVSRTCYHLEHEEKLCVPKTTITSWARTKFALRYAEIQTSLKKQIGETLATKLTDNANQAADLTQEMLEELGDNVKRISVGDLASNAKAMSQIASINTEKALLLRGQPTERVENLPPEEVMRELRRLNVKAVANEELESGEATSPD